MDSKSEAAISPAESMTTSNKWPIATDKPTVEWALPYPGQRLAQGDILRVTNAEDGSPPNLYCVITADCDLANMKHKGRILCLPIFSMHDYVSSFPLDQEVSKTRTSLANEIARRMATFRTTNGHAAISEERAPEWVFEKGPLHVLSALGVEPSSSDYAEFCELGSLYIEQVESSIRIQIDWLQRAMSFLDTSTKSDYGEKTGRGKVSDLVKQTPKDVYLLAEVSPYDREGYVLALRFAEQILDVEVALTPGSTSASYVRISRIVSPYIYSISQQFGVLFTSVGLPDNQHESVKISGDILIASFTK